MREAAWVFGVSIMLFGCGPSEEEAEFNYGEAEIEALVVGTWSGAWRNTPDSTARFTLDVARPATPDQRASCTSRTFSTSSVTEGPGQRVACGPTTDMNLEATLTIDDGSLELASLAGHVMIAGEELKGASLWLGSEDLRLEAIYDHSARSWRDCRATPPPGPEPRGPIAECTLEQRVP